MILTISPTTSKKFLRDAKAYKGDPDGNRTQVGENKKSKFHGSLQGYRPKYSEGQKRWLIDIDPARLQEIVQELELVYESGPHLGEVITRASLKSDKDAFFNHSELFLLKEEGTATINTINLIHELIKASMDADPKYKTSELMNSAYNGMVKFKVEEVGTRDKIDSNVIDREVEAITLFATLSHDRKITILRSMGRHANEKTSPEQATKELYRLITRDKDLMTPAKKTNLDHFLEVAKLDDKEIAMTENIAVARKKGVIKSVSGSYRMGDHPLGKNLEEVYKFFSKEENADLYEKLMIYSK
jgi:hypothetical protein